MLAVQTSHRFGRNHGDMCEHLCDTTSRYDRGQKELSFLLVCALCGTEELVEAIQYEPRFAEYAIGEPAPLAT